MIDLAILGSTGSIGTQALDVLRLHPDSFRVTGLAAGGSNIDLLASQVAEFNVPLVGLASGDPEALKTACADRGAIPEILVGPDAASEVARTAPSGRVLNGITGSIGLAPTLAALESGAILALANKESLVAGGALVEQAMVRPGQIVPVDSEHSAIAQALLSGTHEKGLTSPVVTGASNVARIILTASGGPFRGKKRSELADVTAEKALAHPTWAMGPVVTINSSTLMNKGLELIEASILFDVAPADITPIVHPQSIIHSMVEFIDGSTIAQASPPDMMLPIALGLSWPDRMANVARPCDWTSQASWTFEPVDHQTFPALTMAKQSLEAGPLHPAILNAANEECVDGFLNGKVGYLEMMDIVSQVLDEADPGSELSLDAVLGAEDWARSRARDLFE